MNKTVFFAFTGNMMCFQHILLNALDLDSKGKEAAIVIEGEAVTLMQKLEESNNKHYFEAKKRALIDCICKACSAQLGVLEYNQELDIPLKGNMSGHPAMESYIEQGFQVITL
ncbi:hypothetical protein [Halanaerobium hydrogeniformans]|uniref:Cytoplasmic protein n=1 Tax=Halanaerobium hydrogeniformans TaxID=656519 RepID=E4RND4_HALHG|nr:hypothetical protein [Halanaerobium hydrogeniformans]ADQ13602.1 hypothetical protein Halsa_0111 [Halanaerobium hydrogeniformans]